MATGYEEVREELKGWSFDELMFGLKWELSLAGKKNFEKELILVYLDAIKKTLPLRPFSKTYRLYKKFRRKVLKKCNTKLPPKEQAPEQ